MTKVGTGGSPYFEGLMTSYRTIQAIKGGGEITNIRPIQETDDVVPLPQTRLVNPRGDREPRPVCMSQPGTALLVDGGAVMDRVRRELGAEQPVLGDVVGHYLTGEQSWGLGVDYQSEPEALVGQSLVVNHTIDSLAVRMREDGFRFDRVYLPEMTAVTVTGVHDNFAIGKAFQMRVDSEASALMDAVPEGHVVPAMGDVIEIGVETFLGAVTEYRNSWEGRVFAPEAASKVYEHRCWSSWGMDPLDAMVYDTLEFNNPIEHELAARGDAFRMSIYLEAWQRTGGKRLGNFVQVEGLATDTFAPHVAAGQLPVIVVSDLETKHLPDFVRRDFTSGSVFTVVRPDGEKAFIMHDPRSVAELEGRLPGEEFQLAMNAFAIRALLAWQEPDQGGGFAQLVDPMSYMVSPGSAYAVSQMINYLMSRGVDDAAILEICQGQVMPVALPHFMQHYRDVLERGDMAIRELWDTRIKGRQFTMREDVYMGAGARESIFALPPFAIVTVLDVVNVPQVPGRAVRVRIDKGVDPNGEAAQSLDEAVQRQLDELRRSAPDERVPHSLVRNILRWSMVDDGGRGKLFHPVEGAVIEVEPGPFFRALGEPVNTELPRLRDPKALKEGDPR